MFAQSAECVQIANKMGLQKITLLCLLPTKSAVVETVVLYKRFSDC
jgi:hypothetical protein